MTSLAIYSITIVGALLTGVLFMLISVLNRLEHIAKTLDRIDERGGVL